MTPSNVVRFIIIGVPEEEREKGTENLPEETTAGNFPNLGKEIDIQVQEARGPEKILEKQKKRATPRHLVIKMAKYREKGKY